MSERSWASLAPLLDRRRYVESVVAGVKIHAHRDFRFCATMNDDASTFDIPEVHPGADCSRRSSIDFPERDEEHPRSCRPTSAVRQPADPPLPRACSSSARTRTTSRSRSATASTSLATRSSSAPATAAAST